MCDKDTTILSTTPHFTQLSPVLLTPPLFPPLPFPPVATVQYTAMPPPSPSLSRPRLRPVPAATPPRLSRGRRLCRRRRPLPSVISVFSVISVPRPPCGHCPVHSDAIAVPAATPPPPLHRPGCPVGGGSAAVSAAVPSVISVFSVISVPRPPCDNCPVHSDAIAVPTAVPSPPLRRPGCPVGGGSAAVAVSAPASLRPSVISVFSVISVPLFETFPPCRCRF